MKSHINLFFVSFEYHNGFVASKSGAENGLSFVDIANVTSFLHFLLHG